MNGIGYYGFKIAQSDLAWESFINHLENSLNRKLIA